MSFALHVLLTFLIIPSHATVRGNAPVSSDISQVNAFRGLAGFKPVSPQQLADLSMRDATAVQKIEIHAAGLFLDRLSDPVEAREIHAALTRIVGPEKQASAVLETLREKARRIFAQRAHLEASAWVENRLPSQQVSLSFNGLSRLRAEIGDLDSPEGFTQALRALDQFFCNQESQGDADASQGTPGITLPKNAPLLHPADPAREPKKKSQVPAPARKREELRESFRMFAVGINAIIGAGIFVFPARLAGMLGSISFLAFGFTGLALIPVGLAFAEASTYFKKDGGPYLYAAEAFGPHVGFGVGWMSWIAQIFGWSAVAIFLGNLLPYLASFSIITQLFPFMLAPWFAKAAGIGLILLMAWVNHRGTKFGFLANEGLIWPKLLPLALFITAALALPLLGIVPFHPFGHQPFLPKGWQAIPEAFFLTVFAYEGFQVIPMASGELKYPARSVPRAIIFSLLGTVGLYMAVQFAATGIFPGLVSADLPLSRASDYMIGRWAGLAMALVTSFSIAGYIVQAALNVPRYLKALAESRELPAGLAKPHPVFKSPSRAIWITTAAAVAAILASDYLDLVHHTNLAVSAQFMATCAAIPVLRSKLQAPAGSYKTWFWVPWTGFAVVAATVLYNTFMAPGGFVEIGWTLLLLGIGYGLRALARLNQKQPVKAAPPL